MYRATTTLVCVCIFQLNLFAQSVDTLPGNSDTVTLKNVKVNAFGGTAKLKDIPSAISVLTLDDLQRFDGMSMLSALNSVPGVRMDERTPGSFRLSIRGSLLRSPTGIRNVKIYWDEVPLTNASGNTYLNMVDINHLQSIEVIKGPASSMYGANTGGALILHSFTGKMHKDNVFNGTLNLGSFSLINEQFGWQAQRKNFYSNLQQSHLSNLGYRENGSARKDILKWNANWKVSPKQQLSFLSFYANLHFDNPGGLNEDDFLEDPSQTRDGFGDQQAGFDNHTFFFAPSLKSLIGNRLLNTTAVSIVHTDFKSRMTKNIQIRNEWNYSARSSFTYNWLIGKTKFQNITGAEWQYGTTNLNTYINKDGNPDTFLYNDALRYTQYFFYTQFNVNLGKRVILQTGLSRNALDYYFYRTGDTISFPQTRHIGNILAPRFGVVYKLNEDISLYATVAKGFSPPTLAEVRPSDGNYYPYLQPEQGWNYEVGIKGSVAQNKLDINASFYYFNLKDAIVSRVDTSGYYYYVNAGGAIQKGVELWLKGYIIKKSRRSKDFIKQLNIWNSFTLQPYFFTNYIFNNEDFSGKRLPGIPPYTNVLGIDIKAKYDLYGALLLNCTGRITLDDANTVFANAYQLLQIKVGKLLTIADLPVNIYVGIDNVLNEKYSRGNNINVSGNSYYNPAPGINFFVGGKLNF